MLGVSQRTLLLLLFFGAQIAPALVAHASDTPPAPPQGYEPGRGYQLQGTHLRLGGYASAKYKRLRDTPTKLEISDLSLFVQWDSQGRWRAFSELEIGESLIFENDEFSTADAEFELERAYLDYIYSDRLGFRLGKSLTPIGHWNSIHADPLIWTVSRPLTTDAGFSHYITGLILRGRVPAEEGIWKYQLYLDASAQLDPKPDNPSPTGKNIPGIETGAFEHAQGIHLQYQPDSEAWQLGVSFSHFEIEDFSGHKTLFGMDFLWHPEFLELSGEAIYRKDSKDQGRDEWGAFLQGVAPIVPRWYAIARYEHFKDLALEGEAHTLSLGLAWRPTPAIILKMESRRGRENELLAPDGIFASTAVLF